MFNTKAAPMTNNSSQVQNGQEVNKVYKTSDLSIFKQIDGNRVPNLQHIKRLADSIRVYGMKCNPILVNENFEVIDGQHRLMAAQEANSFVYYIIMDGYTLNEVHTLNLNQKNWAKKDFMNGYADMGIKSYIKFRNFLSKNNDFSFASCLAFCNNTTDATHLRLSENKEVFEDGTWLGKDFDLAQEWANKIRMIKPYFKGYNSSRFIGTMITLFRCEAFDFNEFMHKLRIQPTALVDCVNREQYKTLIEDIYNYRSRNKVSLKY
jgi:hypothetical protein